MRIAMSAAVIIGDWVSSPVVASGTVLSPAPPSGFHWLAPAGLLVTSHSYLKRVSKKELSHVVGVGVHAPSRPEVVMSVALPVP